MKKIIINENWEEEIIEDKSSFFVLIFRQGSKAGYVKAYNYDDKEILKQYQELVAQYEDTAFDTTASILVIKVPSTGQVKNMLEKALYTGENSNPEQLEIIEHLLTRADCEVIGEAKLELTEAKKKKKKKKRKTPKVTYTTGWPWYNDHMFNHHMGSCDCNKDKDEAGEDAADNANDAIGGGDSAGDAGSAGGDFGGDGGALGESLNGDLFPDSLTRLIDNYDIEIEWRGYGKTKDQHKYFVKLPVPDKRRLKVWNEIGDLNPVDASLLKTGISFVLDSQSILENSVKENKDSEDLKEAVDYYDQIPKMAALNAGTRGFNAKAASDEKLRVNRRVCIDHNYSVALKIIEDEMIRRGLLQPSSQATKKTIKMYNVTIDPTEIQPADVFYVLENKNDIKTLIDGATEWTASQTFHNLFIYLAIALYLKEKEVIEKLKDWMMKDFGISGADLRDQIIKKTVNDKQIQNRIIDCINTALEA